jgi:hypothetical protein
MASRTVGDSGRWLDEHAAKLTEKCLVSPTHLPPLQTVEQLLTAPKYNTHSISQAGTDLFPL